MTFKFVPFHDDFLTDAAALLAARHRRDRIVLPELPARFEAPAQAQRAIEALWRRPQVTGMAAFQRGRLMGYLIGEVVISAVWGRSAWIRWAGHALAEGVESDLYRDLYAALGPQWLAYGCFEHYVQLSAADSAGLAAWFSLSFGQEQAHALRSLAEVDAVVKPVAMGLTIRQATPDDRSALRDIAPLIAQYQTQAPVWGTAPPEYMIDLQEGYAGLVDDPTASTWLAFQAGQLIGVQAYFPAELAADDLLIPPDCIELKVGATRPEARGKGIGRALIQRGLAEARTKGYAYCLADWRTTNLLASRFWPGQGFRPMVYRLARRIDPRIAWANGRVED